MFTVATLYFFFLFFFQTLFKYFFFLFFFKMSQSRYKWTWVTYKIDGSNVWSRFFFFFFFEMVIDYSSFPLVLFFLRIVRKKKKNERRAKSTTSTNLPGNLRELVCNSFFGELPSWRLLAAGEASLLAGVDLTVWMTPWAPPPPGINDSCGSDVSCTEHRLLSFLQRWLMLLFHRLRSEKRKDIVKNISQIKSNGIE